MDFSDDDLTYLAANGTPPLPETRTQGFIEHAGDRLWYAFYGQGPVAVLLHGGMGNSGNWSYQVPAIVAADYAVLVMDSRAQGRSTWNGEPLSYRAMAADLAAVLDHLSIAEVAIIGWSDGADTALAFAEQFGATVRAIFYFACNVDSTGTRPFEFTPVIGRMLDQHKRDYATLSSTPDNFETVFAAVNAMQSTQPEYTASDLSAMTVPVTVAIGEHDEFIERTHLQYLAATLRNARFELLPGVSHFAPLQRPDLFNRAILTFLDETFTPSP